MALKGGVAEGVSAIGEEEGVRIAVALRRGVGVCVDVGVVCGVGEAVAVTTVNVGVRIGVGVNARQERRRGSVCRSTFRVQPSTLIVSVWPGCKRIVRWRASSEAVSG